MSQKSYGRRIIGKNYVDRYLTIDNGLLCQANKTWRRASVDPMVIHMYELILSLFVSNLEGTAV